MPQQSNLDASTGGLSAGWRPWLIGGVSVVLLIALSFAVAERFSWTDAQYRQRCLELSDAERWDELEQLAREWAAATQMPDEAYLYLADAQLNDGQPLLAIENLLRVPASSERSFAALITACNLQFGPVNRPLDGVETLKLMISQRPSSISSHQRLIFFYAMTLQRNRMLDAIYDAIAAAAEPPDAYSYLMLADHLSFTNGFSRNSEWLKSDPDAEVFQAARIVQLLDQVRSSENADLKAGLDRYLQTFEQLRQKFPDNQVLLRAALEQAVEDYDVDQVQSLLEQAPADTQDSVILRHRGWLKYQSDEFAEAAELHRRSLAQHALDWHTWHELAACERRLGNLAEAERAAAIALTGKALRKELLQLENAANISRELLMRIGKYAADCGERRVSQAIRNRLFEMGQVPN